MTTLEQEPARTLGYLEGRMQEQSIALQDLKSVLQQINADMKAGFQRVNDRIDQVQEQVNADMKAGFQRVNDRIDQVQEQVNADMKAGFQRVNDRIDQVQEQVNADMKAGFQRVNDRIDQVQERVNNRIDRLFFAMFAVGGAVIAAQLGVIITLMFKS